MRTAVTASKQVMKNNMSRMSSSMSRTSRAFARFFPALSDRAPLLALAIAMISSACGGEGTDSPPVSSPPPPQPAGPGIPAISETGGIPSGYHVVWSDEFDVAGLPDATKWSYDIERNSAGWYNNEQQYYANARAENSRVENGLLVITARKEDLSVAGLSDWSGQKYSSARLFTRDKASWRYGFIEVRAKLPCGVGSWPAIWTLSTPPQTGWPDDGEIDIMEHVGFDHGVVHGTVHTGAYNHVRGNQRGATTTIPDLCAEFHRYQLTWTATRITIGVDDRNYYQYSNDNSGNAEWPFESPQFLILNVAVGGDWGGQMGVNDAIFPIEMQIDYVRVYQP
jgi:beta-glucanase (GH16 family)